MPQAREMGVGGAVERAGAAAADRLIRALLALGVCLSQACGLVEGGRVHRYSGDRLAPLSAGTFSAQPSGACRVGGAGP